MMRKEKVIKEGGGKVRLGMRFRLKIEIKWGGKDKGGERSNKRKLIWNSLTCACSHLASYKRERKQIVIYMVKKARKDGS